MYNYKHVQSHSIIFSMSISPTNLQCKNWRAGDGLLFKKATIDGYAC